MNRMKYRGALVLLIIVLIIFLASISIVKAEDDLIALLHEKLISLGVPVEEIIITKRIPLQIEITLQPNATDTYISEELAEYKQLTFHEALLAHRFGLRVDAVAVAIRNKKGKLLDWEQIYVDDRSPSRQPPFVGPVLDQRETEELFMQKLQFGKMKLKELDIQTGAGTNQKARTVTIKLVASDIESANSSIPNFMGSLHYAIKEVNKKGARLSICKVLITNKDGKMLVDYTYDVEIGRQSWRMSHGVTDEWFPHPHEREKVTPVATSTPWTPLPPFSSPLTTPTP